MSRLSVAAIAACIALFFGNAVHAQQTPAPAAPPSPPPGYGAPITLDEANKVIAAAMAESKKNGWNHVIAVVGTAGNVIALQRLDLATIASSEIAPAKARAALNYRFPTKAYQDRLANGEIFILGLPGMIPAAGGIPIVVGGKIIGAIGVSGAAPIQDHQSAQAGIDALK
jgi:uncharacterized protein GlcG (DUF336 family)